MEKKWKKMGTTTGSLDEINFIIMKSNTLLVITHQPLTQHNLKIRSVKPNIKIGI